MGGDFTKAPQGKSPVFLIHAMKEADGANLDRIQIVKGWIADGKTREKIYDVALPNFDSSQLAVYYVRVLEIPTPRWSVHDAKPIGVEPPTYVPTSIKERAWTSPIWYRPS